MAVTNHKLVSVTATDVLPRPIPVSLHELAA
jgi:hypothetical protein